MADLESTKQRWNFTDLTNRRFSKWLVLSFVGTDHRRSGQWLCVCDCGLQAIKGTRTLTSGNSKSCGCYRTPRGGKEKRREYFQWYNAKKRCTDPNTKNFHHYGGRGITMCDRWLNSFDAFYEDMGKCPDGLTLDREDNDGPYSPENCRWATYASQTRNRRKTVLITHDGETLPLSEWSERLGIPYDRLHDRYLNGKPIFAPLHQGRVIDGRDGRKRS